MDDKIPTERLEQLCRYLVTQHEDRIQGIERTLRSLLLKVLKLERRQERHFNRKRTRGAA